MENTLLEIFERPRYLIDAPINWSNVKIFIKDNERLVIHLPLKLLEAICLLLNFIFLHSMSTSLSFLYSLDQRYFLSEFY